MASESRVCQNCKQDFLVAPEDFDFYKKIGVPAPTFCPQCRLRRRMAFFNLINLYKRRCDLCKKEAISIFTPDAPYKVYCPLCWWSDKWDSFEYGREYDFNKSFFEQLNELWHEVPLLGLAIDLDAAQESPYNNYGGYLKNSYLTFHVGNNEDCAYGLEISYCRSLLDCSLIGHSEFCCDVMNGYKSSRSVGSRNLVESLECFFLRDSYSCQNCFASANLHGKKYYIFNKAYSKEDYLKEIKKWDLGSYKTYQEVKKQAEEHWKKFPAKPEYKDFSKNSAGSYVFQSKNCKECYEVIGAQDSKYLFMCTYPTIKDSYDVTSWGENMELCYESMNSGEDVYGVKFCISGWSSRDAELSVLAYDSSNVFGCISVKNGQYAILNKKYSKKDYEKLKAQIVSHMKEMPYADNKGRMYGYGEFFPVQLSPFAYNETVAQKFFPLTGKIAAAQGYQWRETEKTKYDITKPAKDLPDHIKDATSGITKEVVGCAKCGRGFKIIKMELDFLKRMNLPLPRECPFCRIDKKFNMWVTNLTLVKRVCDNCGAKFETSRTKDDSPKIFCQKCYKQEIL